MTSKYLDKTKQILFSHIKGYPVRAYLYGSWAQGNPQRTSDIDVALLPKEPLPLHLLNHLREAFEESDIPYPVEIVNLSNKTGVTH